MDTIDKNIKQLESYKKKYLSELVKANKLNDINVLINRYRLQRAVLKEDKLALKSSKDVLTKQMDSLLT
jgi:hypothetical protein